MDDAVLDATVFTAIPRPTGLIPMSVQTLIEHYREKELGRN